MAKKKVAAATTGAAAASKGAAAATKLAVAATAVGTQARSQAKAQASDLGDRLAPVVGDARDRLAPVIDDARDRLAPVVDDAREKLVDLTGTVATRIDDLTDTVAERFDDLTGTVATRLDDALPDRVTPAVVKQRVPARNRPNRLLQALFVLGLGTVAALITRRLTGGGSEPTWTSTTDQPSRTPAGGPATTAAAATAGESAHGLIAGNDHASGNVPGDATNDAGEIGPVETSVDVAGGTPEEVAADATDTPHAVTTPDKPAQKVVLD